MSKARWKPIETAPKDGTRILLWLPKHHIAVSGGWYTIKGERDGPHVYYDDFDDWCIDDDVYIMDDPSEYPTHWAEFPEGGPMKHTKEPEVFWIGGDYDSQGRTTEPIDADDNWIKVISYEAYQEIKEKLEAYSEESMKARGLMIVGEDYRDGEVRELKENLARFENPIFDYVNVEANLVYDSPGLLHIAAALVDDHRRLKEECEDLRKKLLTATGAKSIQQKMHEAAKEAWEKENAKLREALEGFKVFGTDECPECINEFGSAPAGANYNRTTLFYKPAEHKLHEPVRR